MKVALFAPQASTVRYDALLHAFRAVVGTTELFALSANNAPFMREVIASNVFKSRFDRVIFLLDPTLLLAERQSISDCTNPILLSLQKGCQTSAQAVLTLLQAMPWMRWIGMDLSLSQTLNQLGYDAQPIRMINPCDTSQRSSHHTKLNPRTRCYLYQPAEQTKQPALSAQLGLRVSVIDSVQSFAFQHIQRGDIFIHCCAHRPYDPLPVIMAMSRGAISLLLNDDRAVSHFYGWQDGQNCLLIDQPAYLQESIDILIDRKDVRDSLSQAAIETASHYSQRMIGSEIGMNAMLSMRDKDHYRQTFHFSGMRH